MSEPKMSDEQAIWFIVWITLICGLGLVITSL